MVSITRALISVADKTGLIEFARFLVQTGIEIISTGGTASLLTKSEIPVLEVADYTGFPELLDGRLKTLHPKIHGGILGRRGQDEQALQDHNILPIDLVIVNLYPFAAQIAKPDCTLEQAIEQIDIGGPTLLRAAAKNFAAVTVIVDPTDYQQVLQAMQANNGKVPKSLRLQLAMKVFEYTTYYDGIIANYFRSTLQPDPSLIQKPYFPDNLALQFTKVKTLRYGENPHQQAAFYHEVNSTGSNSIATAKQLQGKELSFNNIADANAAFECLKQFSEGTACVIVKHANPCGVAIGATLLDAYDRAYSTDPESAFGGIIACNRTLDESTVQVILERQFVEVISAPDIAETAINILATKPNLRVLIYGDRPYVPIATPKNDATDTSLEYKQVNGGLLVQSLDSQLYQELQVVSERTPTEHELADLLFTWKVAKFVKSNAIVYGRDLMTIGIGAGQMSRVNSARIATIKAQQAGLEIAGAVMASDAFFPFRDGLDQAAQVGIRAIIQPGGSRRDKEVIAAANEHNIAMVFTGMRHFRH